jgi:hypothetical protein
MHGGNFGWVKKISTLLKSHMNMEHNEIHSLVAHHRMVYQLHSIIRHAATHSHAMIHKLFRVMKAHGINMKNRSVRKTFNAMIRGAKGNLRTIKHIHVTKSHTSHSSSTTHHKFSFRSSSSTKRTVKYMTKHFSTKKSEKILAKMMKKAKSASYKKHVA